MLKGKAITKVKQFGKLKAQTGSELYAVPLREAKVTFEGERKPSKKLMAAFAKMYGRDLDQDTLSLILDKLAIFL